MASIHESVYTDDTRSINPRANRHKQQYPDRGSSILAYLESVGLQRSITDATVVNPHQSFLNTEEHELREYYPEVDRLQFDLERRDFEEYMLSDTTEVYSLTRYADGECIQHTFDSQQLAQEPHAIPLAGRTKILFINRFLHREFDRRHESSSSKKLRISKDALRSLASELSLPLLFLYDLMTFTEPSKRGFWDSRSLDTRTFNLCYSLPVRVQVDTRRLRRKLNKSDTGLHQLNLPNFQIDIRSSRVVLCYQYHQYNKSATLVAVDFQDGRWSRLVEIPREAMACALDQLDINDNDPFTVNLVYLGIIIAWWRNALSSFGEQLVEHEKYLLESLRSADFGTEETAKLHDQVNISLHNMALHLHRYQSETKCILETLTWLDQKHKIIQQTAGVLSPKVSQGLDNLKSQAESLGFTVAELVASTNSILGLLFNNMSAFTQKMQVSNGVQMQAILLATREDTQASRWIAIVTMLFLPGASFAALLAVPFFASNTNSFFRSENSIYIWVALTLPTTIACFIFYCWKQRKSYLKQQKRADEERVISRSVSGSSTSKSRLG
ncbi:hypothetical protein ABW21_db0209726 [Orbilia brochopaga]|nr:hypothetical protein ABW21_db0209726 [Drechslerella brochopaga]